MGGNYIGVHPCDQSQWAMPVRYVWLWLRLLSCASNDIFEVREEQTTLTTGNSHYRALQLDIRICQRMTRWMVAKVMLKIINRICLAKTKPNRHIWFYWEHLILSEWFRVAQMQARGNQIKTRNITSVSMQKSPRQFLVSYCVISPKNKQICVWHSDIKSRITV